ncbi:MAG: agmatinase [Candidatus Thorarchaeota archaeon]
MLSDALSIQGVIPVVNTFFGAPIDPTHALFVIIGVPFDKTSTYRHGAKEGPTAIRTASQHIESFCLQEEYDADAAKLTLADVGNVNIQSDSVRSMLTVVESVVAQISQKDKIPILLGGEHTLTLAAVRALPRDIVLIQFDAHMDLRDRFNDLEFSHACVQRRITEHLGPDHLIQIGVRAVSKEEYDYARDQNIRFYTSGDIRKEGAFAIAHRINEAIPPGPPLYISIDMDVLDPAYAPAVGNPEAAGLTTSELLSLLRVIGPRANIFDVNELTPQFDQGITAICAANIIKTFLCVQSKRRSLVTSHE